MRTDLDVVVEHVVSARLLHPVGRAGGKEYRLEKNLI